MYTVNQPPKPTLVDIDLLEVSPFYRGKPLPSPSPASVATARENGVVDAVICRPSQETKGYYEILRHLRSWRAAQEAGLQAIPAVIHQISDKDAEGLVTNDIQSWSYRPSKELDPITAAEMFMQECHVGEGPVHGMLTKIARLHDISRGSVWQKKAIFRLPSEVKQIVRAAHKNKKGMYLSFSHLRLLVGLQPAAQITLARKSVEGKLTVRQLRAMVHAKETTRGLDTRRLEETLQVFFGSGVSLSGESMTIKVGGDLRVLAGVLEKCGETLQKSRCTTTFDSHDLTVVFADVNALQGFLDKAGITLD